MTSALAPRAVRVRAINDMRARDPLAWFRWSVKRVAVALAMFVGAERVEEILFRGPNKSGKTLQIAFYVVACAEKRPSLDGVPLPQWSGPVECVQIVTDYEQHKLSVGPAYLRAVGTWPHRPHWDGDILKGLDIMPVGGDPNDQGGWSTITFMSQINRRSGKGIRADIVAFDEPPYMDVLRELRKAGHAWRFAITIINMTPTKRTEWAPILSDYGECPRRTLMRKGTWRAECRWSLDEVASWVLSDEAKARLREKYAQEPDLADAREHGDYCNEASRHPWGLDGGKALFEMRANCEPGTWIDWPVSVEDDRGVAKLVRNVRVQVWKAPHEVKEAYFCVDPASGVEDARFHDLGLHGRDWLTGELIVRWAGKLSPYSLGSLVAGFARQYHGAPIDIEMNDRWGVNVWRGVEDARAGGLVMPSYVDLRNGTSSKEVGFKNDGNARNEIIGAVQQWADAWAAGAGYAPCRSLDVIDNILAAELDVRGKIVAGDGIAHGLDMVLWGQGNRRIFGDRSGQEAHDVPDKAETEVERLIRLAGEQEEGDEREWEPTGAWAERPA